MRNCPVKKFSVLSVLVSMSLSLAACSTFESSPSKPTLKLTPTDFAHVKDWNTDPAQYSKSLSAFQKSCARILKLSADATFALGTKASEWQEPCRTAQTLSDASPKDAQLFFEKYFTPYNVMSGDKDNGLFTGYYEASLKGSPVKTDIYQTPLRARPSDLVMVNLGEFVPDLKGQRIAGRVKSGQLKPYEERKAIEAGKLPKDMDVPLYWVDSAVDAFFLQVQGSGVITFADGTTQRIGYDGQNGHPYSAIGKELIARGALTKDNVSMQAIRDWLGSHPVEAVEIMQTNKSYVFFKKIDTSGPVGAEGVVLTPEQSFAVDHSIWPYGIPMFVDIDGEDGAPKLHKLLMAQDTGGAIKGIIRGDVFWGYGDQAAAIAGPMKSNGKMWVLLPKTSTPILKE